MKKRKKVVTEDAQSEKYYKDILSLLPGHVYWKDKEGRYMGCNLSQAKSYKSTISGVIGKTDYDFFPKDEADSLRKVDIKVMKSETPLSTEELHKLADGTLNTFLSKKMPLRGSKGEVIGILGVSFNVSEIKNKENKILNEKIEADVTLRNIIDNLPEHIYWKNSDGQFIGCNDLQAQSAGFSSREEMIGKTDYEMPWKADAGLLRKADIEVMKTGEIQSIEEPSQLASGKKAIFLSKKIPLRNAQGEIIGILGISFDITERKKLEEEIQASRAREERFKAMSSLGGMIAHELRTPLASLQLTLASFSRRFPIILEGYTQWVKTQEATPLRSRDIERLHTGLESMMQSVKYANTTINTILSGFHDSASSSETLQAVFIRSAIEKALEQYPFTTQQKSLLNIGDLVDASVYGDTDILVHVMLNLIKNAIQAIQSAGRGEIYIGTTVKSNHVLITVKDTAKGIPEEILDQIFEPFFTTKKNTAASVGLGLYFSKLALEKINGEIRCESVYGEYAAFIIELPLYAPNSVRK